MDEFEIKALLDQLADFREQRSKVTAEKAALLEDTKVPEYIQAIVKAGSQRIASLYGATPEMATLDQEEKAALDAIVVPEEIKAQLAAIDAQREAVRKDGEAKRAAIRAEIKTKEMAIQAEIDAQTKGVFDAIVVRTREIEAEFAGKTEAADANIAELEKQIKAAVKAFGLTVKGKSMMATYSDGRKSWDAKRLDKYTLDHPDIRDCYTVGEPVIAIKAI
jgi:hypothetical protein